MRPLSAKMFGDVKNKLAVKFNDGTNVVSGYIVKQLGNKRFQVKKGSYTHICTLAQNSDDITAMQNGNQDLCAIDVLDHDGNPTYVRSIMDKVLIAHDGKRYNYSLGEPAEDDEEGTVGIINHAPHLDATSDMTATQAQAFHYTIPDTAFFDIDGDTITLSAKLANGSPLPGWLTFNPTTREFTGTPTGGDVGTITVRITASDGSATATDDFTITVA